MKNLVLNITLTLSKYDYTPQQFNKIIHHAILRGWSTYESGENDYAKITAPDEKLSTLSKMYRLIRAVQKQNI